MRRSFNLPLLRAPISAGGLMPNVLGDEIAAPLNKTTRLRPLFPIRNSGERSLALSLSEV
jgi:hypothetical protein